MIIEFAQSSLTKDTEEKHQVYATAGIPDYWVVNLQDAELLVYHQPEVEDYQSLERLQNGQILPLAFPDIEILVTDLLP
ncbi:Uma2 family endonuclease [Vacuolonema iberomarrocanum]|uniref:Uma2 family endonuclease n=1 Tax=Vacuolonema iberomarrocanum TaxID=3454632 RepID=UPI003F6DE917